MHHEFWEGVHRFYQVAQGAMIQQRLGTLAQESNPPMYISIVEAAAHSGVSDSLELYWCALVWRKESLKLKYYSGTGKSESDGL